MAEQLARSKARLFVAIRSFDSAQKKGPALPGAGHGDGALRTNFVRGLSADAVVLDGEACGLLGIDFRAKREAGLLERPHREQRRARRSPSG